MFTLEESSQITLCVLYSLGAVLSIWIALFSPYIYDWMGVDVYKKEQVSNWPKRFLISVVIQPFTFALTAIALWWFPVTVFIPPTHFLISLICLIAIDVVREEEPWEKGYTRLF